MRAQAVTAAPFQIMLERIQTGDLGIHRAIPHCVEEGMGVAAFSHAILKVMKQRIEASRFHVGIEREVPVGIEERVWIAALECACSPIMLEWIDLGGIEWRGCFQ